MKRKQHWAILISSEIKSRNISDQLFKPIKPPIFSPLKDLKGVLFSNDVLAEFVDEEEKHGIFSIERKTSQRIAQMSGGEQKKLLFDHILKQNPGFIVLESPFDNLDIVSQDVLKDKLVALSKRIHIILIIRREIDVLAFITSVITYNGAIFKEVALIEKADSDDTSFINKKVPIPLEEQHYNSTNLIEFKNVAVSYAGKSIVRNINWEIKYGDFWQLTGPNGSGKTTLLSMITGDNTKGYRQDLNIFGNKKGSGESVWDIKSKIGFFSYQLIQQFTGRYTVAEMITGGFFDSVGLYQEPSELQVKKSEEWLNFLGMIHLKNTNFSELPLGQKNLVMIARAMIKHPLLLILDEPGIALDNQSTAMVVALINKIACESKSTIVYVSHREEKGLQPDHIFQLTPGVKGSTGKIIK